MKIPKKLLGFVILILTFTSISVAQNYDNQLDKMIQKGIEDWKIPGMAVAVVQDGEVVFRKTYGVSNLSTKKAVNDQTTFTLASTTKAFIAIAMGMLVDEGKVNWDDPVIDHYPDFRLHDPYITRDARIMDLFTHNLGMGNADFLWSLDSTSTKATLERFAKLPASYPLRGGYTYQNIMYAIAGEVITRISGEDWQSFVSKRIFQPLGMKRSYARSTQILSSGNYAQPYYDDPEDGVVPVGFTFSDQIGAAGMMWSSIEDMSQYLQFLTQKGVYNGDTLLKPKTFDFLFQPRTIIEKRDFYPTHKLTNPNWTTYGMGWFQQDYQGEKLDFHTGSIAGLVAIIGIIRDKNTAVYAFANLDHAELRHAIMLKTMDLYVFEDETTDWHTKTFDMYQEMKNEAQASRMEREKSRVPDTSPTLALAKYAGVYQDAIAGTHSIELNGSNLVLKLNDGTNLTLQHWHFDSFQTEKHPKWRNRFLVKFDIGTNGEVEKLAVGNLTLKKKQQ